MRLLIFFSLFSFSVFSQVGTGQWRLHIPEDPVDVAILDNEVYIAYEKGIGVYNKSSHELSIWDDVTGLSDISISCIETCSSDNSVFIAYENGNLDKLKGNSVTNIPAIKLAQIQGSKKIYKMVEYNQHVYLATGFSIVKIDPSKNEVRDTYYPTNGNAPIVDLVFTNDSIYALTESSLYRGSINNIALADPAQWELDSRVSAANDPYAEIEYAFNEIYILEDGSNYGEDSVYHLSPTGLELAFSESFAQEINSIGTIDGRLVVNYLGGAMVYNGTFSLYQDLGSYTNGVSVNAVSTVYDGTDYWIADKYNGLVQFMDAFSTKSIRLSGPPKSMMYSLDFQRGVMAVVSGGLSAAQPTFNRGGVYLFEEEQWSLRDQNNMTMWSDSIHDYLTVSVNPNNKDQIAVGTYSQVPVSIMDETGEVAQIFHEGNSEIEKTTLGNNWSFVSSVQYDNSGNLWVLNAYSNEPLKVFTSDGSWYSFGLGSAAKSKITSKMVIDYNGNKWMAIRDVGMIGYKDQGTIDNASDDQYVNLNLGENSGALPSNEVTALAVDFDNEIWIGTDAGFAVLYNSDNAFEAGLGEYNAQRIKLEYEGNVEYVLGATHVTDIEVDGGNRKWFGTENSGLICLSADGLEILEHHTIENSPLISNKIIDMEINHVTGEMFIITDEGLISYRLDATYEDPSYSNVTVFPNPARPDFDGPITIQGIKYNSDVKITDVAGNLVYKTTSNGGTATWDRRTLNGDLAKTGVYLIWTAPNAGKGRFVGKVLVVND